MEVPLAASRFNRDLHNARSGDPSAKFLQVSAGGVAELFETGELR